MLKISKKTDLYWKINSVIARNLYVYSLGECQRLIPWSRPRRIQVADSCFFHKPIPNGKLDGMQEIHTNKEAPQPRLHQEPHMSTLTEIKCKGKKSGKFGVIAVIIG